jgi:DNA-binding HxlR family transcriptional regulator
MIALIKKLVSEPVAGIARLPRGPRSSDGCAVEGALAVVGSKWALVVLHYLMDGGKRFSDLQRHIPAASPKMLTMRLRELEHLGLLTRTIHAEVPPRVEYQLTAKGRSLRPIIASLEKWGRSLRLASRRA